MTIQMFFWVCPNCATANHDEIDSELGPFLTCVCDDCGKVFDQVDIQAQPETVYSDMASADDEPECPHCGRDLEHPAPILITETQCRLQHQTSE